MLDGVDATDSGSDRHADTMAVCRVGLNARIVDGLKCPASHTVLDEGIETSGFLPVEVVGHLEVLTEAQIFTL